MPQFAVLFKLSPPSYFGLPEGNKLVVKASPGREIAGPEVDPRTGNLVSHGTLSDYRSDSETIRLSLDLAGHHLDVSDNYFTLTIDAVSGSDAVRRATEIIDRFLRLLIAQQGDLFQYELLQIEGEDGRADAQPGPRTIQVLSATMYNLEELRGRIQRAAVHTRVMDERLDKALLYYEHARFLFNATGYAPPLSIHYSFLLTNAFFYLWKALTVILGDPSTDRDYQSRFRSLGLPKDFWMAQMAPLKKIRDQYDVAHYSLDPTAAKEVQAAFFQADLLCRNVIDLHAHLLNEKESC